MTSTGALTAYSGAKTGRSPLDKRVVKEPGSDKDVWWGPVNKPMSPEVSLQSTSLSIMHIWDSVGSWPQQSQHFVTGVENVHMSWESRPSIMCPYYPSAEAGSRRLPRRPPCAEMFLAQWKNKTPQSHRGQKHNDATVPSFIGRSRPRTVWLRGIKTNHNFS
jgi:hypothetical protein